MNTVMNPINLAKAHSSDIFIWDPTKRTFTAEASELFGPLNTPTSRLERVNGHLGFRMRSSRTGKVAWFQQGESRYDGGGDLMFTNYYCMEHDVHAIVFND